MASPAPAVGPTSEGFSEELQEILATAYDVSDGIDRLNAVLSQPFGIRIFRDIASRTDTTRQIVAKLSLNLGARGEKTVNDAIRLLYQDVAGDARLRDWVGRNMPPEVRALVPQDVFDREQPAYEYRIGWRKQQRTAIEGFAELRKDTADERVAAIVADFKVQLNQAVEQLQWMNLFKQLHDRLHDVQTKPFSRFAAMQLEPALDEQHNAEIAELLEGVRETVPQIKAIIVSLQLAQAPMETGWADDFKAVVEVAAPSDLVTLRTLTRKLRTILNTQLRNLNTQLIEAARKIPFDELAKLLQRVKREIESEEGEKFDPAIFALRSIAAGLERAISLHDRWQELDYLSVGIELGIPGVVNGGEEQETIREEWTHTIEARLEALKNAQPGGWEQIDMARDEFGAALNVAQPDLAMLRRTYLKFVSAFRVHFFAVDRALLDRCTELTPLLPELKALAEGGT